MKRRKGRACAGNRVVCSKRQWRASRLWRMARRTRASYQKGNQMVMERENLIEFCENIAKPLEIPVIAGVFLLKSYKNALFINKYVPGANIPENILNRLKDAKDPLEEGIKIAAEQAHDFINIANGVHLMAVKAEHLIPEIIEKADLSLEY